MKGKHHIIVENKRIRYEFDIRRNITVVKGDSATGKTTLIDLIDAYQNQGDSSGVNVISDCSIEVLYGNSWKNRIDQSSNCIFFIDEGNHFVVTQEFAESVKKADAYFVLILRDSLPNLPYSIEEIYGIRRSSRYAGLKKTYNEFYHLYGKIDMSTDSKQTLVVTEDSNSGYDFYSAKSWNQVISAHGKSNIKKLLLQNRGKSILVIADGAAFGSEMESVMRFVENGDPVLLYLPESFEWIILKSNLLEDHDIPDILASPEEYIDSQSYFSWERYFTKILVEKTQNTYLHYQKDSINPVYLHDKNKEKILQVLPEEIRKLFAD